MLALPSLAKCHSCCNVLSSVNRGKLSIAQILFYIFVPFFMNTITRNYEKLPGIYFVSSIYSFFIHFHAVSLFLFFFMFICFFADSSPHESSLILP